MNSSRRDDVITQRKQPQALSHALQAQHMPSMHLPWLHALTPNSDTAALACSSHLGTAKANRGSSGRQGTTPMHAQLHSQAQPHAQLQTHDKDARRSQLHSLQEGSSTSGSGRSLSKATVAPVLHLPAEVDAVRQSLHAALGFCQRMARRAKAGVDLGPGQVRGRVSVCVHDVCLWDRCGGVVTHVFGVICHMCVMHTMGDVRHVCIYR